MTRQVPLSVRLENPFLDEAARADLQKAEEDREEERWWWALEEWPEELRPAALPEKD